MRKHPAESLSAVGGVGLAVGVLLGVDDPETLAALAAVLGVLPGAVTLLVRNGGLRGVARKLWRGA